MRISNGSSDMCSSDLNQRKRQPQARQLIVSHILSSHFGSGVEGFEDPPHDIRHLTTLAGHADDLKRTVKPVDQIENAVLQICEPAHIASVEASIEEFAIHVYGRRPRGPLRTPLVPDHHPHPTPPT